MPDSPRPDRLEPSDIDGIRRTVAERLARQQLERDDDGAVVSGVYTPEAADEAARAALERLQRVWDWHCGKCRTSGHVSVTGVPTPIDIVRLIQVDHSGRSHSSVRCTFDVWEVSCAPRR